MAPPFARVVEVRGSGPGDALYAGSGLLLSERVVITAAHVVFADDGSASEVLVRGLNDPEFMSAKVLWPAERGLTDVAVVWIDDERWTRSVIGTLRWGRFTGRVGGVPCEAIGFPRAVVGADGERASLHATGHVNPGALLPRAPGQPRRLLFNGDDGDRAAADSESSNWSGMSGAGVFAGDLFVGVIILHESAAGASQLIIELGVDLLADRDFVNRLEDQTFIGVGGAAVPLDVESVELDGLMSRRVVNRDTGSSARLLGADAQAVPFRGRDDDLAGLIRWCRSDELNAARLFVGPGGQGKTRLALELCQVLQDSADVRTDHRWVTGFVAPSAADEVITSLKNTEAPVLLVVDYAETRPGQVARLADSIWGREGQAPVRLLLLARSNGEWWDDHRRRHRAAFGEAAVDELQPVAFGPGGVSAAYREAQHAFAELLGQSYPEVEWRRLVLELPTPDLLPGDYGSILTLHLAALTALLQVGPTRIASENDHRLEDLLLDHEQIYWDDTAAARGLGQPSKSKLLRAAVASAALVGAEDVIAARRVLTAVPLVNKVPELQYEVADWLHELYPVPDHFWGPIQPDRIGERLVEKSRAQDLLQVEDLLEVASDEQRATAQAVLARIGERHVKDEDVSAGSDWYRLASEAGSTDAAFQRAMLLTDPSEARSWFALAAAKGHLESAYQLARLLEDETPALAREYLEQAADGGHLDAAYHLGEMALGEDPADPAVAQLWWSTAARAGHRTAASRMGDLSRDEDDLVAAVDYWTMAAEGDADFDYEAAFKIGEVMAWEWGKAPEAKAWYEKAISAGHKHASWQLGWLLKDKFDDIVGAESALRAGVGPIDEAIGDHAFQIHKVLREEADQWLQRAVQAGVPEAVQLAADPARREPGPPPAPDPPID